MKGFFLFVSLGGGVGLFSNNFLVNHTPLSEALLFQRHTQRRQLSITDTNTFNSTEATTEQTLPGYEKRLKTRTLFWNKQDHLLLL